MTLCCYLALPFSPFLLSTWIPGRSEIYECICAQPQSWYPPSLFFCSYDHNLRKWTQLLLNHSGGSLQTRCFSVCACSLKVTIFTVWVGGGFKESDGAPGSVEMSQRSPCGAPCIRISLCVVLCNLGLCLCGCGFKGCRCICASVCVHSSGLHISLSQQQGNAIFLNEMGTLAHIFCAFFPLMDLDIDFKWFSNKQRFIQPVRQVKASLDSQTNTSIFGEFEGCISNLVSWNCTQTLEVCKMNLPATMLWLQKEKKKRS